MKLLIASDLHGSAKNCRALLEAFRREGADRIILLGDLLYHGPRNDLPEEYDTKACTALLNSVKDALIGVRGNCDADIDQVVLEFPMWSDYSLLAVDGLDIFATHGHIYGLDNLPPLRQGCILLCGHIHLPVRRTLPGGAVYLNPGSLALPKEGTPKSYLLLENGVFSWHKLDTGETFQPLD